MITLDEMTNPEAPALIPAFGRAAAPSWRAWMGYGHIVFEQAEGATRDAAIRALLTQLIGQGSLEVGAPQWVCAQQLGGGSKQWLLACAEAVGAGWNLKIMEVV